MSRSGVVLGCAAVLALQLLPEATGRAFAQAAESCRGDIAKACAQVQPGRGRMAQCVRQALDQLSPGCRTHERAVRLQLKETRQPCEDDLLQFCDGIDLTEARIAGCLARNRAALSADCRRIADLMRRTR